MAEGTSFFRRWARRKAAVADDANTAGAADAETRPPEPVELPEIDSLGADSDFSIFMRDGVPSALRKQALRKLWRIDPAFSELDGLVEYGEDYSGKRTTVETVRTTVRLGRRATSGERRDDADAQNRDDPVRRDAGEGSDDGETA